MALRPALAACAGIVLAAGGGLGEAFAATATVGRPAVGVSRPAARSVPRATPRIAPRPVPRPAPLTAPRPSPIVAPRAPTVVRPAPARPPARVLRPADPTPLVQPPPFRTNVPTGGQPGSGAALGVLPGGLALPIVGPAPRPDACWFYTTPARNVGYWATCP